MPRTQAITRKPRQTEGPSPVHGALVRALRLRNLTRPAANQLQWARMAERG